MTPAVPRNQSRLPGNSNTPADNAALFAVGIDVGGTGVKAAVVNLETGTLASARVREDTPAPSTSHAVGHTLARLLARIGQSDIRTVGMPIGVGLPGVVTDGWLKTAANIDHSWLDTRAQDVLQSCLARPVHVINDADAAGLAEMRYGAGAGQRGLVVVLTIGTGIGSAVFVEGKLVPNTEFGHLEFHGRHAETLVSGTARERRLLSWKRWALQFDQYLDLVYRCISPDFVILGGGVSKEATKYLQYLTPRGPLGIARFLNSAGIVGAALAAAESVAHGPQDIPPPATSG